MSLASVPFMIHALQLSVTPGTLKDHLPAIVNTSDSRLELSGSADVTDLALLKQMSRKITTLNMSGLRIKAYDYPAGESYMGLSKFAEGEIPPYMLVNTAITSFYFPAGVTRIDEAAFAATGLRVVTLPGTVTAVGDYAFSDCDKLVSFRFTSAPLYGKGVFKGCKSLKNIEFKENPGVIPESMFDGCAKYAQSPSPDAVTIGAYAYRGTAVETLELENVSVLGDFCFADMPALYSVTLDLTHITKAGQGIFYNDTALGYLPNWEGVLPELTMAYTAGQQPEILTSEVIGEGAFANNKAIEKICLGSQVKTIKANAFRNLSSLNMVDVTALGNTAPEVDRNAFSGLENEEGRYDIDLNVAKDTNRIWSEHPVWGLFNVKNMDTGLVESVASSISVERLGDSVKVSSSVPVDYMAVYAVDGTVLYEARPGTDSHVAAGFDPTEMIIVKVISDNKEKVVKLR